MNRALLRLALGLALLLAPALAEDVKVLLDVPISDVDDLQWFPGGQYLLLSLWADDNTLHSLILDAQTGRWRPVEWVEDRAGIGKGPITCVSIGRCDLAISASGRGASIPDYRYDPGCKEWITGYFARGGTAPGPLAFDTLTPSPMAISASGHYAYIRRWVPVDDGYYEGFWIIRLEAGDKPLWEAWSDALKEGRRTPLVWEVPPGRDVWTASWVYDPHGKPDRLAVVTRAEGEPDPGTFRLLILEVEPRQTSHRRMTSTEHQPKAPISFDSAPGFDLSACP